jgi:hypothetical protein
VLSIVCLTDLNAIHPQQIWEVRDRAGRLRRSKKKGSKVRPIRKVSKSWKSRLHKSVDERSDCADGTCSHLQEES